MKESRKQRERRKQLEQLFTRNREQIREAALTDNRVTAIDADKIVDDLARHLSNYTGQLEDEAFTKWASELVTSAAQFIANEQFVKILQENSSAIRGGIRDMLYSVNRCDRWDNIDLLTEDIFQEVALYIWLNVDKFTKPTKAKLSTRLYGLARTHTLNYHVKKARRRRKAVERRVFDRRYFGCEYLSDLELASMAADEAEDEALAS